MGKSPFQDVSARELAVQITSRKKSEKKLPTWFRQEGIYYPEPLSIEQCSSEKTAAFKASLLSGSVIDLTGGFGVDAYYFSKNAGSVLHCEINPELSAIAEHNAKALGADNMSFLATDGMEYLKATKEKFDTIYIDPARRSNSGKVFMLKDCTPNVVEHIDLLLDKAEQVIIKTSPLLDLTAGIRELKSVAEVHIISTKNECKELLFVLRKNNLHPVEVISTTINDDIKHFRSSLADECNVQVADEIFEYIYEPDVALLKSGSFSCIGERYGLQKLHGQTQLYTSASLHLEFPGRIFQVEEMITASALKKMKNIEANVIVRSYPDKAEQLVKKYKIKSSKTNFLIFTLTKKSDLTVFRVTIRQYY